MAAPILTPDQRLRVFISSTLQELAAEREAAKRAVQELRLTPVMFELGARPHPPRALYRAYLEQSHIFVGIYAQRYGWVAPGEDVSGLEDEYRLSGSRPKLIYVKRSETRDERLKALLATIQADDRVSYKPFSTPRELKRLIEDDLAVLLTERFLTTRAPAPLRASESGAGRSPYPPTPLLGRAADVAAVRALFGEGARLVTLLGPGGVGKTRLALELAHEEGPRFADGAFFVRLEAVTDPDLVVSSVAQGLGLLEAGQPPLLATLLEHFGPKEALLVLDNFEQVVAAAPVIADLLEGCPRLRVLVTSREVLHLQAEQVYSLPPLAVPAASASAPDASPSVALFAQRAAAVRPGFAVTPENFPAVAELCRRLDGLPLAIELAAARVKLFSPQALLARLGGSLELLSGGAHDLPARQQTLQATIRWSYDLLDGVEQRLFRRLAVFVGGASLAAAVEVGGGDPEPLLDKSLLRIEDGPDGEPRALMMQTLRAFALARLAEAGDLEAAQRAHAEHFLRLAEVTEPELRGREQRTWLSRLEREHGNLRAALAFLEADAPEAGLRLAAALWRFWYARGYLQEGRDWLLRLLEAAPPPAPARAKALHGASVLAYAQAEVARADALATESLATARAAGDRASAALALNALGIFAYDRSDYQTARARHQESLAIRRELGDRAGVVHSLLNLGNVASDEGDLGAAERLYRESLEIARATGDESSVGIALINLGNLAYDQDRLAEAGAHYLESLAISRALGDKAGVAHALVNLGNVAKDEGRASEARAHYLESLDIRRELGDRRGVGTALLNLGILALDAGDLEGARRHYQESLAILRALGDRWRVLYLLESFAGLFALSGAAARAAPLFGAAAALRASIGAPMPPHERPRYERLVALVRAALPEARFETLWREGEAWSLDEALARADADV